MSIFLVETYVVRPEKKKDFIPRLDEFLRYKEDHPEIFPRLRSWKLYEVESGDSAACTRIWSSSGSFPWIPWTC